MGAYVGATVVTPSPVSGGLGGGNAYTSPAQANDGLDTTAATYTTPLVIGAGATNLAGFTFASLEIRDFSPSLGVSPHDLVIRARHSISITYAGDANASHYSSPRQVRSFLQYSTDGGGSWNTLASHVSALGADLVVADHTDALGFALTGIVPSALRMREMIFISQFQTTSAFTGGTFTINSQLEGLEVIADTKNIASMMGFM